MQNLGRVLCGVGVAILMASPSVYIAETVHPDQRAMLSSIVGLSFNSGVCILWFLGYFFDWQTVAFLSTCPAILAFIGFLILPDTPYWLIQKNREEEAFEALKYFRKNDPEKEVIDEFNEMLQHLRSKTRMSHFEKLQSICSLSFIKPFLCIGILYPLHELSGCIVTTNYFQSIMIESMIQLEARTCSLILGFVRLFSSFLTLMVIQKLQPKWTFVGFVLFKAITLLIIGFYFMSIIGNDNWKWVPLTMFVLNYFCMPFLFSIIWTLVGEMFPSESRNFAAGLAECFAYSMNFVLLKTYVQMKRSMGLHGIFFFFARISSLCAIYASLTIPDNRGKSLSKIEKSFSSKTPLISKDLK